MKKLTTTILAALLVGCGPQPADISIHQAVFDGNIAAVKQHLDAGAEVDAKDDKFVGTFLHWAAAGGQNEIVELLIAKGADVNATDGDGDTPLHLAGNNTATKEVAELLIAKGADVNAKNNVGDTPLDCAILFEHTETADLLRKHGSKSRF